MTTTESIEALKKALLQIRTPKTMKTKFWWKVRELYWWSIHPIVALHELIQQYLWFKAWYVHGGGAHLKLKWSWKQSIRNAWNWHLQEN